VDPVCYHVNKETGVLTPLGSTSYDESPQSFSILNNYVPPTNCPTVTDLNAIQENLKAKITWTAPEETADLTGYKIYDGSTEIGNVPVEETTFITQNLDAGSYTFGVEAIYDNDCIPQMVTKTLTIIAPLCNPIIHLEAIFSEDCNDVILYWEAPEGASKYNIFRDAVLIKESFEETTYTDENVEKIIHTWSVTVVCEDEVSEAVSKTLSPTLCSGINNFTTLFSIVPNPANNNISITAKSDFSKVEIVNFVGQTVHTQPNNSDTVKVDVSNLTNGIYFVRIGTSVRKFVKQ
jgi:hypothetical protein